MAVTVEFYYLVVILLCYIVYASVATAAYAGLDKEGIKKNRTVEMMRDVSLAQMILSWIFVCFHLVFLYFLYYDIKGANYVKSGTVFSSGLDSAFYALFSTGVAYLVLYGLLNDTSFATPKKIENDGGETDESATSSVLASMVVNFIMIFVFFFVVAFRGNISADIANRFKPY